MASPRPVDPARSWTDDGFPPRTFPVEPPRGRGGPATGRVDPEVVAGPPPRRRGRGPWLAVGAGLIALLFLAAIVLLVDRDDDDADLAVDGTTTTVAAIDTSVPSFDTSTTLATTTSIEPVSPTLAPDGSVSTGAPGVLETSTAMLAIPRVNAGGGPQSARLTLRNTGPGPLGFTTTSSAPGLSASPARGTIAAGRTAEIVVGLDGSRVPAEGPFSATLTIGGTGGTKAVRVSSLVGRAPVVTDDAGEPCSFPGVPCSRQIKLAPPTFPVSSPCNTPFAYAVNVADQSRIQSVRAIARRGLANADAPLLQANQPSGTSGVFQSAPMVAVPAGLTLRLVIEATDQLGFTTRLAEQTIAC